MSSSVLVFALVLCCSCVAIASLVLFVALCGTKQPRSDNDDELYESSTAADDDDDANDANDDDANELTRKGGVLFDADGNRRPFSYMCHHCGTMVSAEHVVWAPVGGARVPPWRAFYEQAHTGSTHYLQTIALHGATRVSACATCAALSNDAVRYTPPPDLVRRADESRRRYQRDKDRHMAEKAAAKAAAEAAAKLADAGAVVAPRLTPRRDEPIYVPGNHGVADSLVMTRDQTTAGNATYDSVRFDTSGAVALPREFVFCADCDESDIDYREIDRATAEKIITSAPPGSYVVRPASKTSALSMTYYDIDAGKIKNVLLRHESAGWITDGVDQHFPSLTALRDHILIAFRFSEPGVNFQPLDRVAAEEIVRNTKNQHYLVRPTSAGDLCLTVLLRTKSLRHVILKHEPNGWRATGMPEGPFRTVKELLAALPPEFDFQQ